MFNEYPKDRYDLRYGNQYRSGLSKLTFWGPTRYEFLIAGIMTIPVVLVIAFLLIKFG